MEMTQLLMRPVEGYEREGRMILAERFSPTILLTLIFLTILIGTPKAYLTGKKELVLSVEMVLNFVTPAGQTRPIPL